MLTHFSLFTGIGGADIAAEMAGFETIGQVEWADYPTKVLEKHWPNVPRWRDIRDVSTDNVRNVIGQQHITVLSGGFPCQPFSVAGKRKGKDDDRFLWPEMLRVISELKPTWVIGENVNGFVNMGLEDACVDLENQGYEVQPFVIPACAVQAWHERKRVFIVAYADGGRRNDRSNNREERQIQNHRERNASQGNTERNRRQYRTGEICSVFSNARCKLLKGCKQFRAVSNETGKRDANIFERPSEMVSDTTFSHWNDNESIGKSSEIKTQEIPGNRSCLHRRWEGWQSKSFMGGMASRISDWMDGYWGREPDGLPRVTTGVKNRVDRLKCLGNAIVPQQIYPIFKTIADIESQ